MNVVLFIFDSLRKDCIEYFGSPYWGKVHTPNLSRFAEESFVLSRCYPESLPTLQVRKAIYTGKRVYPFEDYKYYKGDFAGALGWGPIREDHTTISENLQLAGYTTALFSDIQHQFKPSKNFHRGFDEWHWIRGYEFDAYRTGPKLSNEDLDYWYPKEIRNYSYKYHDIVIKNIKQAIMNMYGREKEEDYFVAKTISKAVDWLEQNKDNDNLFLTVESWSPHELWFVPENYRNMYTNGKKLPQQVSSFYRAIPDFSEDILKSTQANYSGLVTMCDKWFGYFINSLKKLNMFDDTLIIVTSDHGHSIGDNNYLGKRGYPSSPEVYDVPLFIKHPNYKKGIENNSLVQHTDITATIFDIIGLIPRDINFIGTKYLFNIEEKLENYPEAKLHGKSFLKNLLEENNQFRDHATVAWGPAVTVITDNWWLNIKINGKGALLYDLKSSNPFDNNVADSNPEVIKKLFNMAIKDAGGEIPKTLIERAENEADSPGCSALVALKSQK